MSGLVHYVSLDGAGGVELQFAEFAQTVHACTGAEQAVVACGRRVHPLVRDKLARINIAPRYEKYAGRLKLPKWPPAIRAARQRIVVRRARADAVIVWNRLRAAGDTLAAAGPRRCIYWEHGASWFAGDTRAKRLFLARVRMVLCNSVAARRMLELRWGYTGAVRVVHNALRPSLVPRAPRPRQLHNVAPLRLGVAARLTAVKGVALALHSAALLARAGRTLELRIAGDGPERARLAALAGRLGIARQVVFEGLVADMGRFYRDIDMLVHPALREPFGQVALEAGAHGVPAVVAAVDGLVEVVAHGVSGLCVVPTRAAADYPGLGGGDTQLPPFVYDPARDGLVAPKLVDPAELAAAIATLADDANRYTRMSARAIETVRTRFDFARHVREALAAIDAFVGQAGAGRPRV